ncbi:MAG: hypothetical protein KBD16_04230 [Candidatus Pacebacteria bacterium]|nr:hypothetical protein [Candidatus Paceibacterota bacterium]
MKTRTRNLLTLFVTVGALLAVSAAKADGGQDRCWKESYLGVALVDADAESPVQGNEAKGYFSIMFGATAVGPNQHIPKKMRREEDFLIMRNQTPISPSRFLVAASSIFDATPPSSCDTPWTFCIAGGQMRMFTVQVTLEYPQQPSFFAIRLRRLNVSGKVKYEPSIRSFHTDSVFISNIDYD